MRRFHVAVFLLSLLFSNYVHSQDVTAYLDYRDYLQIFEKGIVHQAEYLKPNSYKIGGNAIAYIDHKNDFKIYYKGEVLPMVNAADFTYSVSDNLIAFTVGNPSRDKYSNSAVVLYVFDDGERKTLCYYTSYLNLNDSILVYFDDSKSSLFFYYNHGVAHIEDALLSNPKVIKTGSNTVAWVNQSNLFNVFYHGTVYELDNIPPRSLAAGRDLVAYVDDYEQKFRLFYRGDTAVVEDFEPDSFKVGFGIMAYVDNLGNFRVFDNGGTKKLISDRPDFFTVTGNVIVYAYNKMFNVYYKGSITTLQNSTPLDFQVGNEGVAWIDDSGRLKLFDKGAIYDVSYESINKYFLNGNVLKYEVGVNTVNVFYKGKNN